MTSTKLFLQVGGLFMPSALATQGKDSHSDEYLGIWTQKAEGKEF